MDYLIRPASKHDYNTPTQLLFLCLLSDGKGHSRRDASKTLSIGEKTLSDDVINPLLRSELINQRIQENKKPYHITRLGVHHALADLRRTIPAYKDWSGEAARAVPEVICEHQLRDSPLNKEIDNYLILCRKLTGDQCSELGKNELINKIRKKEEDMKKDSDYEGMIKLYSSDVAWQGKRRLLVKGTNLDRLLRKNSKRISKKNHETLLENIQKDANKYIEKTLKFYEASKTKFESLIIFHGVNHDKSGEGRSSVTLCKEQDL